MTTEFKPSQVILSIPPLTACFKKTEAEAAAGLLVWTCQQLDDKWQSVTFSQMASLTANAILNKVEPVYSWSMNPFLKPSFEWLSKLGYINISPTIDEDDYLVDFNTSFFESLKKNKLWLIT